MLSDVRRMTARAWLVQTVVLLLVMAIAVVLLNVTIDIYGLFRNSQGHRLAVYGDKRIAKYLLSRRYVPGNFDALLIGSSISANWNTSGIACLRVYNESLDGGNIVEEKAVAGQALESHRIKVAIVIINPYLTSSHEFETTPLTPRENFAALGSQSLLEAYKDQIRGKLNHSSPPCDEFGTYDLDNSPTKLNATLRKMMAPGAEFDIDEAALNAHRALIAGLRAANVRTVYVIPPISQALLIFKDRAFAHYSELMLKGKPDREPVIDFLSDEFLEFRENPENFRDGVHLNNRAARQVVSVLNDRLAAFFGKKLP